MKKTCITCGKTKPEKEFDLKSKESSKRRSKCKSCQLEYQRQHYKKNKDVYKQNSKKQREKNKAINYENLMVYLKDHPCVDCGENDPVVLTFDHVKGEKKDHVGRMLSTRCWKQVEKEIAKCVVRCANCHMRKTAKQRGWRKSIAL